mmetsp:Transcript_7545/g.17261  ORF Transcript_7545/g.17261 Transcript_7545/m.17261 type:complete len:210 (-) Transcript_7545:572-1201(-)
MIPKTPKKNIVSAEPTRKFDAGRCLPKSNSLSWNDFGVNTLKKEWLTGNAKGNAQSRGNASGNVLARERSSARLRQRVTAHGSAIVGSCCVGSKWPRQQLLLLHWPRPMQPSTRCPCPNSCWLLRHARPAAFPGSASALASMRAGHLVRATVPVRLPLVVSLWPVWLGPRAAPAPETECSAQRRTRFSRSYSPGRLLVRAFPPKTWRYS